MKVLVWLDDDNITRTYLGRPETHAFVPAEMPPSGGIGAVHVDRWFALGWDVVSGAPSGSEERCDIIVLERADS